jgi:hypothetical protein
VFRNEYCFDVDFDHQAIVAFCSLYSGDNLISLCVFDEMLLFVFIFSTVRIVIAKKKESHIESWPLDFRLGKSRRDSSVKVDDPNVKYGCLPQVTDDRWLQSMTGITGLCNQLFAVFSAVPVALVLNSSLLLGPMYSRKSFGLTHREFHLGKGNHRELPFSMFFDFQYFQDYWKAKKSLAVVESNWEDKNLSHCRNLKDQGYKYLTLYRPRWRPYADYEFTDVLLNASRIPSPIQPRAVINVKSVMGMMAMYDFYQSHKQGGDAPMPDPSKLKKVVYCYYYVCLFFLLYDRL